MSIQLRCIKIYDNNRVTEDCELSVVFGFTRNKIQNILI